MEKGEKTLQNSASPLSIPETDPWLMVLKASEIQEDQDSHTTSFLIPPEDIQKIMLFPYNIPTWTQDANNPFHLQPSAAEARDM